MCLFSSPSVSTPPPPQEKKQPDVGMLTNRMQSNRIGMVGGAVRTGPAGLQPSAVPTGRSTVLGGT